MNNLNLKQKLFITRYIACLNATQAALDTYQCKNKNVAAVTGYRLLRNVNISGAIENILDKAGLSNEAIARKLKQEVMGLSGIKAIKLALKLHGFQNI